jgi:hypothetical protein
MSSQPYGKFSGMATLPVTAAAVGVQAFAKVTSANQIGDQATEGDIFRAITNESTTLTLYFGETQAKAAGFATTGYPLRPGETFCLMGPSGAGWKGDLWVAEGTGVAVAGRMSF